MIKMESSRCEDCGNQAKKECAFRRCRTCCKNRGFSCQTHIASTWIPLHTRRHLRLHPRLNLLQQNPKRLRPAIPDSSESKFPVEVNSMAVFRCLRVSSFHGGGDEFAYRTSVSIGGHVFTGILYNQGHHPNNTSSSSSSLQHHPLLNSSITVSPASLPPPFSINAYSPSPINFPDSKSEVSEPMHANVLTFIPYFSSKDETS